MLNKARKKMWTLRNMKKSGMKKEDMLKIFNTVIRPIFDYAVSTYHSMLSIEMSNELERIQRQACKIIYGWDTDYDMLQENGTVESLKKRRERMVLNFARKTVQKERFKEWFPQKNYGELDLRRELLYEEKFARTERLKRSPVYYMRRELNKDRQ